MPTPDLTKLGETLAKAMESRTIECPQCHASFALSMVPKLQDNTILTLAYELQEGHMMQATSIGESIAAMGRLLRSTAKHIGGNVEVFINNARFEERKISFDFLILPAPVKVNQRKKCDG
jgi:hypothetical protein